MRKTGMAKTGMARKRSKRLVIDASVAHASGRENAVAGTARHCTEFLIAMRQICHRVVMTDEIADEWNGHQSRFASAWLVSMYARKKVVRVDSAARIEIRTKLGKLSINVKQRDAMLKDCHLLDAASSADGTVVSLDEKARNLFTEASYQIREYRGVVWVKPDYERETPVLWLKQGAAHDSTRRLGYRLE